MNHSYSLHHTNSDSFNIGSHYTQNGFPYLAKTPDNFKPPQTLLDLEQCLTLYKKGEDLSAVGLHFYMDDYRFAPRLANRFNQYVPMFQQCRCVLTPDYSIIPAMGRYQKKDAVGKSRLFGKRLQDLGICVIPTLQWGDDPTLCFCFDGIPVGGVVSVSTVGVAKRKKRKEENDIFARGFQEAMTLLKPKCILLYGTRIKELQVGANVEIINYANSHFPPKMDSQAQEKKGGAYGK